MYADDLQLYTQCSLFDLHNSVKTMNADLKSIADWSNKYGLSINPSKTQAIIIGSPQLIAKVDWTAIPSIQINNTPIPYSATAKNLGLHFDQTFSWTVQLNAVRKKMFGVAASLRRLRNILPIPTKIALAQSLLFPILDYADVCYPDLTECQLNSLERLQNLCIRFIFGLRKYDHISEFRARLKWFPIRLRRNTHILHLLYSILFDPKTPPYLKQNFSYVSSNHSLALRSSNNLTLSFPHHHSKFFHSSFTVTAISLWNALPEVVRRAQSLPIFKKELRNHYASLSQD
ncbi:uncharacterized protein LOC123703673 [Colias croceus]|uniref:uncharacterized protein LOC123703673 n=1 Tax=Colias crocea TaxID=72248 RepID=UPI001E27AB46|nr:uncharacterized protein LOC123703673 [Colias croceus]